MAHQHREWVWKGKCASEHPREAAEMLLGRSAAGSEWPRHAVQVCPFVLEQHTPLVTAEQPLLQGLSSAPTSDLGQTKKIIPWEAVTAA